MSSYFVELNRTFTEFHEGLEDDPQRRIIVKFSNKPSSLNWNQLLQAHHVLVLGEAGTGKSTEFKAQVSKLRSSGEFAWFVRIDELAQGELSDIEVESGTDSLERWRLSGNEGSFFLDALDEAKIRGMSLTSALRRLQRGLRGMIERARVIVSCRVSDWCAAGDLIDISEFTQAIEDIGSEATTAPEWSRSTRRALLCIVRMDPLSEEQIKGLLEAWKCPDIGGLLREIKEADVWTLIERPADVIWLCDYWRKYRRLGTLCELIEHNVQQKLGEKRGRATVLTPERAYQGAMHLAGIVALSGRHAILVPDSRNLTMQNHNDIIVGRVLDNWTPREIDELLSRPIFDEASYGRIRFHSRTVQEYLAGKWLKMRLENGYRRRSIRELLFRANYGEACIPAHLAPVVSWLSLWDRGIRDQALQVDPETLIQTGDPASLPAQARVEALRAFVEKYHDAKALAGEHDPVQFRRIASAEIERATLQLLQDESLGDGPAMLLLQLVGSGQMRACAKTAMRYAQNSGLPDHVRGIAVSAVGAVGVNEEKQYLCRMLDHKARWSHDLAGMFVAALFPEFLDVAGLMRLLSRLESRQQTLITSMQTVMEFLVPVRCPPSDRLELLGTLLESVGGSQRGAIEQAQCRLGEEHAWLLPTMGRMFDKILDDLSTDVFPDEVQRFLSFLKACCSPDSGTAQMIRSFEVLSKAQHTQRIIQDSFAKPSHGPARRALFWHAAFALRYATGRLPTDYYRIAVEIDWLRSLNVDDLPWLTTDCELSQEPRQRILIFDTIMLLPLTQEQDRHRQSLVAKFAQSDQALRRHLDRYRLHLTLSPPMRPAKHRLLSQVIEMRNSRRQKAVREGLTEAIERIRTGTHITALLHLAEVAQINHDTLMEISLDRMEDLFGKEVCAAARQGLKSYWKLAEPGMPHKRASPGLIPNAVWLGLKGVSVDFAEGFRVEGQSQELLRKAIRYAAWELSKFPEWLEQIASVAPVAISEELEPAIRYDFISAATDEEESGVLRKVARSIPLIRDTCTAMLTKLIEGCRPARLGALTMALQAVSGSAHSRQAQFESVLASRCAVAAVSSAEMAVWWGAWLECDQTNAISFLEGHVDAIDPHRASAVLTAVGSHLWELQTYHQMDPDVLASVEVLHRLIALFFSAKGRENKPASSESPFITHRDQADLFKDQLPIRLAQLGTEDSLAAIEALADDSKLNPFFRDWLRARAKLQRTTTSRSVPYTIEEAITWSRCFILATRSTDDLFKVVLNRLDDIQEFLITDRYSILPVLQKMDAERELQLWVPSELERRALGLYHVEREPELSNRESPDIEVIGANSRGIVCIEIKSLSSKYSLNDLKRALREQLVGKYLRDPSTSYGIFLLGCFNREKYWIVDGGRIGLEDVMSQLKQEAEQIQRANANVLGLDVVGIRFYRLECAV